MKQRVYKETGDFTDDVKLQDRGDTDLQEDLHRIIFAGRT